MEHVSFSILRKSAPHVLAAACGVLIACGGRDASTIPATDSDAATPDAAHSSDAAAPDDTTDAHVDADASAPVDARPAPPYEGHFGTTAGFATTTITIAGAARAVGKVLPKLKGNLDGVSLRVPVPDGSVVDLVATVSKDVTIEEINAAYAEAAKSKDLKGILEFSIDPLVSSDIVHNAHSTIFDSLSTMVMEKRMVKLVAWYDNEWGYSNRVVELMRLANKMKLPKDALKSAPKAEAAALGK